MSYTSKVHTIAVQNGPYSTTEAKEVATLYRQGLYVVHAEYPGSRGVKAGYTLSHLMTGMRVMVNATLADAKRCARVMHLECSSAGADAGFGVLPDWKDMDILRRGFNKAQYPGR